MSKKLTYTLLAALLYSNLTSDTIENVFMKNLCLFCVGDFVKDYNVGRCAY